MIRSWKLEAVARLLLGLLATYCFGMLLVGLLEHFVSGSAHAQNDFWQILAAMLFLQIPALVWISLFLRQHGVGWAEAFGLKTSKPAAAVARGLLVGALFLPAAGFLVLISQSAMESVGLRPQEQTAVQVLQDPSLTMTAKVVLGVITIILAPAVEEPLFRGILYPAIKQQGYPRLALWGSFGPFRPPACQRADLCAVAVFRHDSGLSLRILPEISSRPWPPTALFNAANFLFLLFGDQINQRWHLP